MAQTPETVPATVLVIDDNEANRALALHTLEDEGYRVVLAASGEEGIARVESEPPDCVLLDVRMPGIDGFAVCERIRALPDTADMPVVFLTALRDVDTFDRALRAGGNDFLTKPVRPTELVVRVQSALKLRRLGTELREHYELLRHQRDGMLRLQLQKERLMAFIVHDLKNPVHAMDLNAQLLGRDPTLSSSARDSAKEIRRAAQRLNRMILNLLDVSKADEGKLVAKRIDVDLRAMVDSVVREVDVTARERDLTLRAAIDVARISADEDLLRRTLTNLVENAIRHAPRGTAIDVRAVHVDHAVELRVVDTGKGVPAAMRDRIFNPFVQSEGDGVASSRAGRGLGLAFCRFAIEAHGGAVWVEDASPGAVFALRIPDAS